MLKVSHVSNNCIVLKSMTLTALCSLRAAQPKVIDLTIVQGQRPEIY
jgi:hypothetical protein